MRPLFCDRLELCGIAPMRALDKMAKQGIRAYDVHKCGITRLNFCVKSKETKKIFAIFDGSCYTVTKIGAVGAKRWVETALRRPGILIGAALFLLVACVGNQRILRIEVTGSAARYREQALVILEETGLEIGATFDAEAADAARAALLNLPCVVFASVDKSGCVLTVALEESAQAPAPARADSLIAPRGGSIEELTVLRGTAQVREGERVEGGQTIVGGYFLTESGERRETPAIARCSLLCEFTAEYASETEDETAYRRAVAAAYLRAGGEPVSAAVQTRPEQTGVVYVVTVCVRVRISVNMA